ncbi:MAG: hypothetical protein MUC50_00710 [Myxococcota bacterium]|jgi:hypothetical protein|nr:hypothetical protein [Myxococcota bacterium]
MGERVFPLVAAAMLVWGLWTPVLGCKKEALEGTTPKEIPRVCQKQQGAASDIWSDKVRTEVALAVRVFEGKLKPGAAEQINRGFVELSETWQNAATEACSNYLRNRFVTDAQHAATVSCLDRIVADAQTLISGLSEGKFEHAGEVDALAGQVSACLD